MQFFGKKIEFSLGEERTRLLICIGIALVIWTFLKLSDNFYTTRHVHLEYQLPAMLEFVETPPDKLLATVYGTGLSIIGNYLRNPHPSITIDLRENAGRTIERNELLAATQDKLRLQVTNLDRNYLSLDLDSMASKKVPIRLEHDLKFADDFFPLDSFRLSPDSVFVSGTPDHLARVTEVVTEKATSSAPISAHFLKEVALRTPQEGKIQVVPSSTELSIEVEQFTEKKFTIPVEVPDFPDSVQLIPSEVAVKCVVGLSRYEYLQPSSIRLEADVEGKGELAPQNSVPVKVINAPSWVRSIEVTPPVVEFFIVQ